jgi:sugar phosphate isomerase/epimerase
MSFESARREINRRQFLGTAGSAAAMMAFGVRASSLKPAKKLGPIGVQLYTVRDDMKKDFAGTLAKVAKIGYKEVEFAGYFGNDPKTVRDLLTKDGLAAPSAHIGFPVLGKDWDKIIEDSLTVGHQYLICPWIEEKYRTVAGYKEVAALFNKAGEQAKKAGLQFGFHNHNYEFPPVEGQVPLDLLITQTDPSLVVFEMDVYWVRAGGADPVIYFKRYPGRFPLLHIKDMDSAGKMVDVGRGVIPWKTIFQNWDLAGVKHIFVEHDEPHEPLESIRHSYEYLSTLDV